MQRRQNDLFLKCKEMVISGGKRSDFSLGRVIRGAASGEPAMFYLLT